MKNSYFEIICSELNIVDVYIDFFFNEKWVSDITLNMEKRQL